ncbi:MAG: DNA-formamidopyrimidine glycosylase family protein [Kofleriaceae bacterium]
MPEGHTLHKAVLKQTPMLIGTRVRATSPQKRLPGIRQLDGATVTAIEAFGKHLFYRFAKHGRVRWLHVHLGLAGRFDLMKKQPPPAPRSSVRVRLAGPVYTVDLRGPLICEIVGNLERAAIIASLGPDPIRKHTSPAKLAARLARTRVPIGAMLLDQSAIAGVGNVYRAELLWMLRIDPRRASNKITRDEVDAIWRLARTLMRAGVLDGRIVTTKYGDPTLVLNYPRQRTYAYKQRRCVRCGAAIDHVKLAGRPCFFCPHCQTI